MSDNRKEFHLDPTEAEAITEMRARKQREAAEQAAFKDGSAVDINELDRKDLTQDDYARISQAIIKAMTEGR